MINALDQVHFRSQKNRADECQFVSTEFQGVKRKMIVAMQAGRSRPYMLSPEPPHLRVEFETLSRNRYIWDYL